MPMPRCGIGMAQGKSGLKTLTSFVDWRQNARLKKHCRRLFRCGRQADGPARGGSHEQNAR
jgi:hypothetical protein